MACGRLAAALNEMTRKVRPAGIRPALDDDYTVRRLAISHPKHFATACLRRRGTPTQTGKDLRCGGGVTDAGKSAGRGCEKSEIGGLDGNVEKRMGFCDRRTTIPPLPKGQRPFQVFGFVHGDILRTIARGI